MGSKANQPAKVFSVGWGVLLQPPMMPAESLSHMSLLYQHWIITKWKTPKWNWGDRIFNSYCRKMVGPSITSAAQHTVPRAQANCCWESPRRFYFILARECPVRRNSVWFVCERKETSTGTHTCACILIELKNVEAMWWCSNLHCKTQWGLLWSNHISVSSSPF